MISWKRVYMFYWFWRSYPGNFVCSFMVFLSIILVAKWYFSLLVKVFLEDTLRGLIFAVSKNLKSWPSAKINPRKKLPLFIHATSTFKIRWNVLFYFIGAKKSILLTIVLTASLVTERLHRFDLSASVNSTYEKHQLG